MSRRTYLAPPVLATFGVLATAFGVLALMPGAVSADSFTPIRMKVRIASVARGDRPLIVQVHINADAGVLDVREGALRTQVRLTAGHCGGVFDHTSGTTLLDRAASPQPVPGRAYSGGARGGARPSAYGVQTVCAFLDDDVQQFASNAGAGLQVNVSRPCTVAAARFDRDLRRYGSRNQRTRRDRRRALGACGPGVAL